MHRLKLVWVTIVSGAVVACGVYLGNLARLTNSGYCHAAGRYLTDDEKIKVALEELLKKYPPSVVLRKHHPDATVRGYLPPENPVYYQDVTEFLSLNPGCCKVTPTEAHMEGGKLTLIEKLTGTATSIVEVTYLVRYQDPDNTTRAMQTTDYLHITSCGTPGQPWSPY